MLHAFLSQYTYLIGRSFETLEKGQKLSLVAILAISGIHLRSSLRV